MQEAGPNPLHLQPGLELVLFWSRRRSWRWRGCSRCRFEVRWILAFFGKQCDHRADINLLAWLHINGGDGAVVVNGKLHGGLVGLHISNNVS